MHGFQSRVYGNHSSVFKAVLTFVRTPYGSGCDFSVYRCWSKRQIILEAFRSKGRNVCTGRNDYETIAMDAI